MFASNELVTMKFPHCLGFLRISTMPCQIFGLILLFILGVTIAYHHRENYLRDKAVCHLPVHYGNCGVRVAAWYYNPRVKSCRRFLYALCGGNMNRFYTKKECEILCLNM